MIAPLRPTKSGPSDVRNPSSPFDTTQSHVTARKFIVKKPEAGEAIEVSLLSKPRCSKGNVRNIDLGTNSPTLYLKRRIGPRISAGAVSAIQRDGQGTTHHETERHAPRFD